MSSWIEEAEELLEELLEGEVSTLHPCDCEYDPYVTAQESEKAPVKFGE
jgi:hypothetical protein